MSMSPEPQRGLLTSTSKGGGTEINNRLFMGHGTVLLFMNWWFFMGLFATFIMLRASCATQCLVFVVLTVLSCCLQLEGRK